MPRIRLVAATSSAPSAEPWILPVFFLFGAGQPMIVRSEISDGRAVSARAASNAAASAATFSSYSPFSVQSTWWTSHPYASYRARTSSDIAIEVSSSIEISLSS